MPALRVPTLARPNSLLILFAALAVLTAPRVAAVVSGWELQKGPNYIQGADDTPPPSPVVWQANVCICAAPGDATSATVSGGGITGSIALEYDGEEWCVDKFYGSQAAMNAEFPSNTTYTLTLSGGTLGTVTQSMAVGAEVYPNVPYLTGPDLSRMVNIDATAPFTMHWNDAGPNATAIFVEFEEKEPGFEYLDGPEPGPAALSGTIPADTLSPGKCYEGLLGFENEVTLSGAGGFGADGFVFHARQLVFEVFTVIDRQPQEIVGAWQFGDGAADESGVLVFQANGIYFHAEDAEDFPGEPDGMERGTYSWNPVTGSLVATPNVDTNGPLGLSNPVPAFTASIDGSTMTLSDSETTILQRVASSTSPIEGGWRICDGGTNDTGVLVFLDNGFYFHAEVDDPGGMERGTYSWNPGTGDLTATALVDTNGTLGLSDPAGSFLADVVAMKVLTLEEGVGAASLYRVTNAAVRQDPEWRLVKGPLYLQTADNSPGTLVDWCAYGLVATRNPEDATSVAISGGGLAGNQPFVQEDPEIWEYEGIYASEALLDADFPSSTTYTITVSGGELGTISQDLTMGLKGYPNVPFLTGTNFTDANEIDPTQPFTLVWNAGGPLTQASGVTGLEIFEDLGGGDEGDEFYRELCAGEWTTTTLPALTLPAGESFIGFLETTNADLVSGAGAFGTDGVSSHNTSIDVPLTTVGGAAIAENAAENAGLTGANALPAATPFNDGVSNILKYAFNMNLAGADSGTLEGGTGTSGLPTFAFDQSVPNPVVKIEFIQRKGAGLVYTPKRSTTLGGGSFTPIVGSVTVTPIDENFDRVVVEDPCDPNVVPKCFWTIEVDYE